MIVLRKRVSCSVLLGLVLTSTAQAFTPIGTTSTVPASATVCRVSNTGWDNENYLNSLDKDQDNQNEANDEYYRMSKFGRTEGQDRQQWLPQQTVFDVENDEWPDFDGGAGSNNPEELPAFLQDDPYQQQQQQQFNLQRQEQQQGIASYGQQQPQRVTPYEQQPQVSDAWAQQFPQNPQINQQQQPQTEAPDPYTQQLADKQQQYVQQQEQQQPPPGDGRDELPNDNIDGAVFTDAMKAKVKASHSAADESSGGGRLFREMMAKAQQQAKLAQSQQQQQQQQQPPTVDIPGNAMDLSVAEQAKLFRDIMAQRQHEQLQQQSRFGPSLAQQQQRQHEQEMQSYAQKQLPNYPYGEQSAKPQFLPPGTGYDGRKIGRNRDAYMISTTADVYFAQLKQDSSSRNMARINGDDTKANEVFGDPAIQDITLAVNPYQKEARLKERDVLETIPEEALLFQDYGNKPPPDRHSSGISYKEKMEQAKRNKANNSGNGGNENPNNNNNNNNNSSGIPSFPRPTGGGQAW